VIVKPDTVIAWHRKGFRMFWAWKSRRGRVGRPAISADVGALIRQLHRENAVLRRYSAARSQSRSRYDEAEALCTGEPFRLREPLL
jgi:hypothetical protein